MIGEGGFAFMQGEKFLPAKLAAVILCRQQAVTLDGRQGAGNAIELEIRAAPRGL